MSDLVDGLRERADWADYYTDAEFLRRAASHIEAQEAENARLTSSIKDMADIIERVHDSGEMVDGGDLRYWVQLLRFALSKATLSQKEENE